MKVIPQSTRKKRKARRVGSRAVRTNAAGRKLMTALHDIIEGEKRGGRGLIVRKVEISAPKEYDPAGVRVLIDKLGISTELFAQLMGVSSDLAEAWQKNDSRSPNPTARRLFDLIAADPTLLKTLMVHRKMAARSNGSH
jgi:DNA-binding transcriptional regulator YiaG